MYFLLDACKNPTILRVLYFGYLFWEIVAVLVPIGLIVMLMVDFTKAVVISKEDEQVKSMKLVVKRIMYAVFIFATPWIVSVIMNILGEAGIEVGGDYTVCLNTVKNISAGKASIEDYDSLLDTEEEINEDNNNSSGGNSGDNSGGDSNSGGGNGSGGDVKIEASNVVERLMRLLEGELGQTNGIKYGSYYDNDGNVAAWCGYFASWALKNTKLDDGNTIYQYLQKYSSDKNIEVGEASGMWPLFRNSSNSNINFYKSKAYGGNYTPKAGDILWFQYSDDRYSYCRKNFGKWDGVRKCADHVGIVTGYANGRVSTIEGNSSHKVSSNSYLVDTDIIIAYGSWY